MEIDRIMAQVIPIERKPWWIEGEIWGKTWSNSITDAHASKACGTLLEHRIKSEKYMARLLKRGNGEGELMCVCICYIYLGAGMQKDADKIEAMKLLSR